MNAKCYDEKTFKILGDNNIKTRIFWKDIRTSDWIKNTYDFLGINPEKINLGCENKVTTFCDGMENFKDCKEIDWKSSIHDIDQALFNKYNLTEEEANYIRETVGETVEVK